MNANPEAIRLPFERVVLRWQQYAARKHIPNDIQLEPWLDEIFDELVLTVRKNVLQDVLAQDAYRSSFTYCDSWFQLLKLSLFTLRWFGSWRWMVIPRWAQRRWPVKSKTHTFTVHVERSHIYPESSIAPEKLGRPVILERITEDKSWMTDWLK